MGPRRRTASILLLGWAVVLAGCGGTSTPIGSGAAASAAPSVPAATLGTSTAAPATSTPTAAPSAPAAATASPVPTASAAPSAPISASFSCDYPYRRAGTSAVVQVRDVRVGAHASYDRVVFQFDGARYPTLLLSVAKPPFTMDPSDKPLAVPGASFVLIRLIYASGGGYSTTSGKDTYTGPDRFDPKSDTLVALVERGDFEAHMSWIAGLSGPACYRVTRLANPARIAIDFEAR